MLDAGFEETLSEIISSLRRASASSASSASSRRRIGDAEAEADNSNRGWQSALLSATMKEGVARQGAGLCSFISHFLESYGFFSF